MTINASSIDSLVIDGVDRLEYGSGSMFSITQVVSRHETGSGSMMAITQIVSNSGSGSMFSITQVVLPAAATYDFYTKNGWYPYLYINGLAIDPSQIHGPIVVRRVENDAASMEFTLIPPRGSIDLSAYEGKSVILNVRTSTGMHRVYTGKINIPNLDLNLRKLTFSCTDNRRELINQSWTNLVDATGYYSENVFGVAKDKAQELDNRLTTVPKTLNFDVFGVPNISSTFAAATPDYTFTASDVYRDEGRDPHVILTPRSKVVNTVNITYEYRYQRMYAAKASYTWAATVNCNFLTKGYSLTKRDIVISAAKSTGWQVIGDVICTTAFLDGWYTCGGIPTGFSWTQTGFTNVAKTATTRDSSGALITTNVVDANGKQVYTAVPTSYTDYSQVYCDGAAWTTQLRWAQNLVEKYTMTVKAPSSVTRFGIVSQDESAGLSSTYDSKLWTDNKIPTPTAGNTLNYGTNSLAYYWDENTNYSTYIADVNVLLNKAKTTLLKSHRENRVVFNIFLKPEVDLKHTVQLTATSAQNTTINAKGKVYSIAHTMDPREGSCNTQIELALSVSAGADSDDVLSLPTRPVNNLLMEGFIIGLGSTYGVDPALFPTLNGFFGNAWVTVNAVGGSNTYKTQYPECFVVDSPAIGDAYTQNINSVSSSNYYVNIVDDTLTIVV